MPHKVFIAYSSRDKLVADAACAALEAQRIPCWIAPRDVLPGVEYGESIIRAINDSEIVLLIFSSNSNSSPQVRREIERAVSKAKIILPFRIEDVIPTGAMEYALSSTHWLDALTPPLEKSLIRLRETVGTLIDRRTEPSNHLWEERDGARSNAGRLSRLSKLKTGANMQWFWTAVVILVPIAIIYTAASHYHRQSPATFSDTVTGTWTVKDNGENVNWEQAYDYCKNLRLNGYSDWRLPSILDLELIYNPQAHNYTKGNIEASNMSYWSDTKGFGTDEKMAYQFTVGMRGSYPKTDYLDMRALCMRGTEGQVNKNSIKPTNETWTDPISADVWTATDNGMEMNWEQANNYCRNLNRAGNSDWVMPTVDQLKEVYSPIRASHVPASMAISKWTIWSASIEMDTHEAWYFDFLTGDLHATSQMDSNGMGALCVRRPEARKEAPVTH
jgi:hypothetical protein